jgi:hypothetical protein
LSNPIAGHAQTASPLDERSYPLLPQAMMPFFAGPFEVVRAGQAGIPLKNTTYNLRLTRSICASTVRHCALMRCYVKQHFFSTTFCGQATCQRVKTLLIAH